VDRLGGVGATGQNLHVETATLALGERGRHLGAAGVLYADEGDAGWIGWHGQSSVGSAVASIPPGVTPQFSRRWK